MSESGDFNVALLKVGEILMKALDTGGGKEHKHLEIREIRLQVVKFRALGLIQNHLGKIDAYAVEKVGNLVAAHVGGNKEELLVDVLLKRLDGVVEIVLAMENLPFAVDDVFLQVERDLLGGAEIFESFRNGVFHLLGYSEKVVDSDFACKDNSRVVGQIDMLRPEVFVTYSDNFDKLPEGNVKF